MTNIWYQTVLDNLKKKLELKILWIFLLSKEEKQDLIDIIHLIDDVDNLYSIDERINDILKKVSVVAATMIDWFNEEDLSEFKSSINLDLIQKSKIEQSNLMWQIWIDLEKHINI